MISVIIPIYNGHEMSQDCIYSVLENTKDCELVIIDNGSTPPFKPPFSGFVETTLIRNETNTGFPCAINQGIKKAKGDTIILLNNDVVVTPGWAEKLTSWLYNDEFSIIGPVTNFAAGMQRVAIGNYNNIEELNKEVAALAEECSGEVEEVNYIIGFCMAFKKSLYDEIGPFDESMWPSSGEEIDFCYRAKAAGHKIGFDPCVYVHHEGSQTFKALHDQGVLDYPSFCQQTSDHITAKWGDFWNNQAAGAEPKREAVTIGDHTYGSENMTVLFDGDANLTIGKYCSIGPKLTVILGGEHRTDWLTTYPFSHFLPEFEGYDYRVSKGDVNIGNDVWIGYGVTILSGVTIGDGAVIGAGAVIASDVLPYNIVAGNPAEVKGYRKPTCKWWEWPDDVVYEAIPILQSGDDEGLYEFARERGLV